MSNLKKITLVFTSLFLVLSLNVKAQNGLNDPGSLIGQDKERDNNPVQTAVPFLTISPDSRAGALGDAGVATSPDANSMFWNPSKYAFVENDMGLAVSFTPWLRNLVDDIYLGYLSGYKRLDDQQVIAASLRYFSLGEIIFTNKFGDYTGQHTPNEFSLDAAYARKFSNKIAGSLAFRFIRSDLTGGGYIGDSESKPGTSYAADVSAYYKTKIEISDKDADLAIGLNISNIGTKIGYTEETNEFIPINMRLGAAFTTYLDQYNSITFIADFNKLLVPTSPEYYSIGDVTSEGDTISGGDLVVKHGKDPKVSLPVGMIQSFSDAPGITRADGTRSIFAEEIQEIMYSLGAEYWYNKQFAIRGGYFHENVRKGNRKYFTVGMGLKLNVIGIDFAYLIPVYYNNNPLANTVRFTIIMDMAAMQSKKGSNPYKK